MAGGATSVGTSQLFPTFVRLGQGYTPVMLAAHRVNKTGKKLELGHFVPSQTKQVNASMILNSEMFNWKSFE